MKSFRTLHDEHLDVVDPVYHCENCGVRVYEEMDMVDFKDTVLCQTCYDELPTCHHCGEKVDEDDSEYDNDNFFCDEDCLHDYLLLNQPVGTL